MRSSPALHGDRFIVSDALCVLVGLIWLRLLWIAW